MPTVISAQNARRLHKSVEKVWFDGVLFFFFIFFFLFLFFFSFLGVRTGKKFFNIPSTPQGNVKTNWKEGEEEEDKTTVAASDPW